MREELRQIGLNDEEINIYLALIRSEGLKVTEIARKLNLARSTVYRFVVSLHEKGLVSELIINNAKTYSALEPNKLPQLIQTKAEQVKEIVSELETMKKDSNEGTAVMTYRGMTGLKTVMNDILEVGKDYTTFGEVNKFFEEAELFTNIWMRKTTEKKLKGRLLNHEKVKISKYEKLKILPKELFSNITTATYGNKTAIFIWKKPHYVVVIDDKEVTESNRKVFDGFWRQ